MTDHQLPVLRWGILGCGRISKYFVQDICLDRPEATTRHVVQAIGTSSKAKGSDFVASNCPSQTPTIYDDYQAFYQDPNVDVVYIATPHALHRQHVLDSIAAGKHVLCEKPLCMTAKEAEEMMKAARAKGVYLLEGMWVRFQPVAQKLQSLLHDERVLGDIRSIQVDLAMNMPFGVDKPNNRTNSRDLGAGALMDLAIYPLTWASLALDQATNRDKSKEPNLKASMVFYNGEANSEKRVDESNAIILSYPEMCAQAICTSSWIYDSSSDFAYIRGEKGSITVGGIAASIPRYLIVRIDGKDEQRVTIQPKGMGFEYEADAVAEDIRAGRTESEILPFCETLKIMSRLDEARRQCGLVYPQDK